MKKFILNSVLVLTISFTGCAGVKPTKALLDQYEEVEYVQVLPMENMLESEASKQISNYYSMNFIRDLDLFKDKLDRIEFIKSNDETVETKYVLKSALIGYREVDFTKQIVQIAVTTVLTLGWLSVWQKAYISIDYEFLNKETAETLWFHYCYLDLGSGSGGKFQIKTVKRIAKFMSKNFPYYNETPLNKKVLAYLKEQEEKVKERDSVELVKTSLEK